MAPIFNPPASKYRQSLYLPYRKILTKRERYMRKQLSPYRYNLRIQVFTIRRLERSSNFCIGLQRFIFQFFIDCSCFWFLSSHFCIDRNIEPICSGFHLFLSAKDLFLGFNRSIQKMLLILNVNCVSELL
jgi:hypothetical protein